MIVDILRTVRHRMGLAKYEMVREATARSRGFREMESLGLLDRQNYAYGLLRAAGMAKFLGVECMTVCAFGVATSNGLVNMIELAERITREMGVGFRIVGFDTGEGLPGITDYRDHPELWSPGDLAMFNRDELTRRIAGRAELRLGDIKDTVGDFVASLSPSAPIGFLAIDVDIYSATRSALRCLDGDPALYAPAVSVYFDDVSFFFANRWCGELLAIDEFNAEHPRRKLDRDHSLNLRPGGPQSWHPSMYVAHILDHEVRNRTRERPTLGLEESVAYFGGYNVT